MDFIGQASIIQGLRNEIKNETLGHAYAFTGERGLGKRTIAHYAAKLILCTDKNSSSKPCGVCRACRGFEENINPNFNVVKNETKKILIKQIRDIIEDISVKPSEGRKVYLIEDADLMTPEAQNCLLKTLEEPPVYGVILMTTSAFESLLLTVRSRVVQIRLKPYSVKDMESIAKANGINIDGKEHLLAISGGNPGRLIELDLDKSFDEHRKMVLNFVFNEDTKSKLELNQYMSKKKSAFTPCMDIMETLYRDALLVQCSFVDGLINSDKKDNIIKYAKRLSSIDISAKIARIQEVRSNLKRNMNYQLAVDMVTLDI